MGRPQGRFPNGLAPMNGFDEDVPGEAAAGTEVEAEGIEILSDAACLDLLNTSTIGRIGLSAGSLPVILPVNFALDGGSVVVATGPGLKLRAAQAHDVACLEVDHHDPVSHLGWSVLVTGRLDEISRPQGLEHAEGLPLAPWRQISDVHYIRLSIDLLSGRRLRRRRAAPPEPLDLPPYLHPLPG